jgi:hypothetical protein
MNTSEPATDVTRGTLLRAGAVAAAGAAAITWRPGDDASVAAGNDADDARILNFFLTLEYVQEAFYRQAVESGRLKGELLSLASAVGAQESEHVRLLLDRLGDRAQRRPRSEFGDALTSSDRFRRTAIDLEEAVIAGYVGQAGNLGRRQLAAIARLVSVEARQVAWLRSLEGVNPAPRAADPARKAGDILDELRRKGFLA